MSLSPWHQGSWSPHPCCIRVLGPLPVWTVVSLVPCPFMLGSLLLVSAVPRSLLSFLHVWGSLVPIPMPLGFPVLYLPMLGSHTPVPVPLHVLAPRISSLMAVGSPFLAHTCWAPLVPHSTWAQGTFLPRHQGPPALSPHCHSVAWDESSAPQPFWGPIPSLFPPLPAL